jgi:hypothetical protein
VKVLVQSPEKIMASDRGPGYTYWHRKYLQHVKEQHVQHMREIKVVSLADMSSNTFAVCM